MNYHEILGVPENSSIRDIRIAYRRKAKQLHPDLNASPSAHEEFIKLQRAYKFLCADLKPRGNVTFKGTRYNTARSAQVGPSKSSVIFLVFRDIGIRILYSFIGGVFFLLISVPTWGHRDWASYGYSLPHLLEKMIIFVILGAATFAVSKGTLIRIVFELTMELTPSNSKGLGKWYVILVAFLIIIIPTLYVGQSIDEYFWLKDLESTKEHSMLFEFVSLVLLPSLASASISVYAGIKVFNLDEKMLKSAKLFIIASAVSACLYNYYHIVVVNDFSIGHLAPALASIAVLFLMFVARETFEVDNWHYLSPTEPRD